MDVAEFNATTMGRVPSCGGRAILQIHREQLSWYSLLESKFSSVSIQVGGREPVCTFRACSFGVCVAV